jgi:hypothetical protein
MAEVSLTKIQGYLLANAEELIERTKRNKRRDIRNPNPQPVVVKKVISDEDNLDNFSDLFNAFSGLNQVDFITDLPDEVRVKLRPSVRIFKSITTNDGKEVDLELKSSVITGVENLINPGVAIKDVEIVRLGGNPEEVNTNITVKVRLYATKLGHYFDKQYPAPIKNFSGDVPDDIQSIIDKGISWLDLIKIDLDDPATRDALTRLSNYRNRETFEQIAATTPITFGYDEPEQRIKLEITYGDIGDVEGYSEQIVQKFRELVASQKEVLFLSLAQNKIEFNDDGTAEIQIDYVGSGGTNVYRREHDLLFDPYLYELELRINDEISAIKNKDFRFIRQGLSREQQSATQDFFGFDNYIIERALWEGYATKSKVALEQTALEAAVAGFDPDVSAEQLTLRQRAIKRLKDAQAGLLFRGLYGPTLHFANDGVFRRRGGERTSRFGDEEFSRRRRQRLQALPNEEKYSRVYVTYAYNRDIVESISPSLSAVVDGEPVVVNYFIQVAGVNTVESAINLADNLESSNDFSAEQNLSAGVAVANDFDDPADQAQIQFVFLGDIIEVALEVLSSNNRFGTDESFETKFFEPSNRIAAPSIGPLLLDDYERSYVRPFYSLLDTFAQAAASVAAAQFPSAAADAITENVSEAGQRNRDKILQRIYQEYGEILFSDIVYQNPASPNEEIKISLADLPICLAKYKNWISEKIISKKRNTFYFKDFISSLMNTLVRPILAERYSDGETRDKEPPELLVNRINVDAQVNAFLDAIPSPNDAPINAKDMQDIRQTFSPQASTDSLNAKALTIISQSPVVDKPVEPANRREFDRERNVPHILFGDATNGILQNLSFERIDMPGLREARLFEGERMYNDENYSGPNIYREKYNASLSLVGTTFFRPGTQFYLDPLPLDLGYAKEVVSPARLLGLGGYYLVVRATHQINLAGSATWETSLDTQWQSFGDDDGIRRSKTKFGDIVVTSLAARLAAGLDTRDPEKINTFVDSQYQRLEQEEDGYIYGVDELGNERVTFTPAIPALGPDRKFLYYGIGNDGVLYPVYEDEDGD